MDGTNNATLKGRLANRRGALLAKEPFFMPVPGYEGLIVAKYRALDYRTIRRIGMKQADNPDQPESEIAVAADSLVNACLGLYGVPEDWDGKEDTLIPTGHGYSADAARELFGVGQDELPEGSGGRLALLSIVPDATDVVLHYAAYDARSRQINDRLDKTLQGESEASSDSA